MVGDTRRRGPRLSVTVPKHIRRYLVDPEALKISDTFNILFTVFLGLFMAVVVLPFSAPKNTPFVVLCIVFASIFLILSIIFGYLWLSSRRNFSGDQYESIEYETVEVPLEGEKEVDEQFSLQLFG